MMMKYFYLSQYPRVFMKMTGLRVKEVCAELTTFVPGRPIDDDAMVLLRFDGGATGTMWTRLLAHRPAMNRARAGSTSLKLNAA